MEFWAMETQNARADQSSRSWSSRDHFVCARLFCLLANETMNYRGPVCGLCNLITQDLGDTIKVILSLILFSDLVVYICHRCFPFLVLPLFRASISSCCDVSFSFIPHK